MSNQNRMVTKTAQTIDQAIVEVFSMKFPVIIMPARSSTLYFVRINDLKELYLNFDKVRKVSPTSTVIMRKPLKS